MKEDLKARHLALQLLEAVLDKHQPLDQQMKAINTSGLPDRDRAFARQLVMSTLRHLGEVNGLLKERLSKPLPDNAKAVKHILRLGVAQLIWLDTPPHAAIDTAVNLTKQLGFNHQSGLVNAVLRRISEKKDSYDTCAQIMSNIPKWLQQSWREAYGDDALARIAAAHLVEPPLDIATKADVQDWAQKLEGEVIHHHSIRRDNANVSALVGYDEGAWWVQDVAATLPVQLLGDVKGKRVLDICAAPGGKTAQLLAGGADVVALDRSSARLKRMTENMARLGYEVPTVCADVMKWEPEEAFDAILLDAPCSATGTIRRHPDILYLRKPDDVQQVCELQRDMLARVVSWLKPGGVLVYCVCSLQPAEGDAQVTALLESRDDVALQPAGDDMPAEWINAQGCVRTLPHYLVDKGGMDGFFAAKIVKQ